MWAMGAWSAIGRAAGESGKGGVRGAEDEGGVEGRVEEGRAGTLSWSWVKERGGEGAGARVAAGAKGGGTSRQAGRQDPWSGRSGMVPVGTGHLDAIILAEGIKSYIMYPKYPIDARLSQVRWWNISIYASMHLCIMGSILGFFHDPWIPVV